MVLWYNWAKDEYTAWILYTTRTAVCQVDLDLINTKTLLFVVCRLCDKVWELKLEKKDKNTHVTWRQFEY